MEERLQKIIASCGVCSRRAAEELIERGLVCVNGRTASLGEKADLTVDSITVDGKSLQKADSPVYLMLNKPRGYVTTLHDEKQRKTAAELVSDCGVRVYPVGRLDMDSEGLLLFTNDGELAFKLMHPSHEVNKTYEVLVRGLPADKAVEMLSQVEAVDDEPIRKADVKLLKEAKGETLLEIVIHEGKNRQIRRMCAQCGLTVKKLCRIKENDLSLGTLSPGKWRYLTDTEIMSLMGV